MPDPLPDLPPLREGLMQLDPPRLLGAECRACGGRHFPARTFCPACNADDALSPVALSPRGLVHSWTIVRQAPAGRKTPYTLAYVDLDDGVRLLAQLEHAGAEPGIGMPVQLALRAVEMDDGSARLGYRFTPLAEGNA
ncbi:Zn-ribbon domain-containing OB-fold protein [Ramlibacter sp.]|uniref:Zn-ribbon domain-containing OB-fold protein n=1 Tax=Ramlibacter sp. TaxID=1917967 RepID=UPI003D099AA7